MVTSPPRAANPCRVGRSDVCVWSFTQKATWKQIHTLYQLPAHTPALNLRPRYNGWPTQGFASLRLDGSGRTIATLRWGLVPS